MAHAKGEGITVGLDCGFVPCMFPEEAREVLKEQHFGASPCIPVLDILPTGDLISCYPLEALGRVPLSAGADAAALRSFFESKLSQMRQTTLFPDCVECREYLAHECAGGCLAASLRRLHSASKPEIWTAGFPIVG
jgi:radical SAM protein with 4Fe4S-binding SPASM domain